MIRYNYPPLAEYLAQEKETIKYLMMRPALNKYGKFRSDLCGIYDKLRSASTRCITWEFLFETKLEKQEKRHCIKLSGQVKFDERRLTFSSHCIEIFGEVGTKDEGSVIRQMHFDVAFPWEMNKKDHPLYHVQCDGKYDIDCHKDKNACHISLPRIPFYPLSLALFLNMAIKELGPEDLKVLIAVGKWKEIVRSNEDKMIYPFWENVMTRRKKDHSFIIPDVYYESGNEA